MTEAEFKNQHTIEDFRDITHPQFKDTRSDQVKDFVKNQIKYVSKRTNTIIIVLSILVAVLLLTTIASIVLFVINKNKVNVLTQQFDKLQSEKFQLNDRLKNFEIQKNEDIIHKKINFTDLQLTQVSIAVRPQTDNNSKPNIQIKQLNLSNNYISVFKDNYIPTLQTINLSKNSITQFSGNTFPLIQTLELSQYKNITQFKDNDLSNLKELSLPGQLKLTNLSGNKLDKIQIFTFYISRDIKEVTMNNNNLNSLTYFYFQHNYKYFENNNLKLVNDFSFLSYGKRQQDFIISFKNNNLENVQYFYIYQKNIILSRNNFALLNKFNAINSSLQFNNNNMKMLKQINLYNCELKMIKNKLGSGIKLFSNNTSGDFVIQDGQFDYVTLIDSNIKSISIKNCSIKNLTLRSSSYISRINFINNSIRSLQEIELDYYQFPQFHSNIIDGNISKLNLRTNLFYDNSFPGLSTLFLYSPQHDILDDIITNSTSLIELQIEYTSLKQFTNNFIPSVQILRIVSINELQIKQFSNNTFSSVFKLTIPQKIQYFNNNKFSLLTRLKLQNVKQFKNNTLDSITNLSLSGQQLSQLDKLNGYINLKQLQLSICNFETFNKIQLDNLVVLNITQCSLKEFKNNTFKNLKILNLEQNFNGLSDITKNSFMQLQFLSLSFNNFTSDIGNQIVELQLTKLKQVNLIGNQIEQTQRTAVQQRIHSISQNAKIIWKFK